jgi:hypothetical protein
MVWLFCWRWWVAVFGDGVMRLAARGFELPAAVGDAWGL